jgi:hypothetical protein
MARVTMGQTKEYSLPDQVKVNTDEKEKKFLEENIKTKKGTRKKTKGEKINEMLKDAQEFQDSKKREKTKGEEINERLIKAQKEMPGLKKGGRVKKKNTRRMNRLEELGRVDAEKAYTRKGKRNLRSEKKRIVRELKSSGGSAGAAIRGKGCEIR